MGRMFRRAAHLPCTCYTREHRLWPCGPPRAGPAAVSTPQNPAARGIALAAPGDRVPPPIMWLRNSVTAR
jgi:hypothetical protein